MDGYRLTEWAYTFSDYLTELRIKPHDQQDKIIDLVDTITDYNKHEDDRVEALEELAGILPDDHLVPDYAKEAKAQYVDNLLEDELEFSM